jgi:hypothetical protein
VARSTGLGTFCRDQADNAAYRLVEELGAGECADARHAASIEDSLQRLILQWERGLLTPLEDVREEAAKRFSRAELAGDLAELLRSALR